MVRATTKISVGLLTAFLCAAGLAAANPIGILTGEGGGEAEGEAHGSYYADASGALELVDEQDARDQVMGNWHNANSVYDETKASARAAVDNLETPAAPECACEDVIGQLDQVGEIGLEHADSVEKAADLETGIVDAGADVGATAQAKAFFKDTFTGVKDAFSQLTGLFGAADDLPTDDAKGAADELMNADAEARNTVTSLLETDADVPKPDPRVSGDLAGQHASKVTSEVLGSTSAGIP